ncbi:SPRY domain-containing protein, putative [Eimeria tenella]|uniref:SPRY domain-containing protein, putative n=1 Tax=Eimeria tenella TaxID=5802 RepID=U6L112_EIMTE|nr:SPRY domain-containing protein, putative [Eimeria tenella]CDJ41425.1 SPRY domain-containing protein, putative [Eimeria tenella]|eukprot:XP_013232175.1 SPRY domain-containing protein, putative [Eimeria tenella]
MSSPTAGAAGATTGSDETPKAGVQDQNLTGKDSAATASSAIAESSSVQSQESKELDKTQGEDNAGTTESTNTAANASTDNGIAVPTNADAVAPANAAPTAPDGEPSSSAAASAAEAAGEEVKPAKKQELLANGLPKIVYDLPSGGPPSRTCDGGVYLDAADSHLDLQINKENPLKASCMHTGGFQYMWKGVRSTFGVKGNGKFYFEVKVGPKPAPVVMPDTPASTQHVCRVGVSQPLTSLHLGDSAESWGFGGTGKKSTARKYLDYGTSFGEGDVIGVGIDLDNLSLSFKKNNEYLGAAFQLPAIVRETGLFPHIYVKNFDFEVNFRQSTKWFEPPGSEFRFVGDLKQEELIPNPVEHPRSVSECEFIMMCGLPACGKTYWIERHIEKYPKKSYVLLGTNAVIDQMKVMGLKRQANYANRWEELMSTATEVFNSLVAYAGSGVVPRNVIIDQTNVFKRARARKVQPFLGWGTRRCVVMVTDEPTLQQRTQKREREEGKMVPVAAVMDMKAAFALPSTDDGFTVIDYVEMPESESRREIRRINEEGRAFKANNPGLNNRQPKPHIEARGAFSEADMSSAKRHKGDQWQGGNYQSWSHQGGGPGAPYGSPHGGRNDWGQGQQHSWGGRGPQGEWHEQHQGSWQGNSEGGGMRYSSRGNGGYGYGAQWSESEEYRSHYQSHQQYGQKQGYGDGYYGQQHQQQYGSYDSRYRQGGGDQQQQWQQSYGNRQGQYGGGGNRDWQGYPPQGGSRGGGGYSGGGYYQQHSRY